MEHTQADTIIGADVHVKGNLKNKGSIQINGTVEGEIKSEEDITVGESASVVGPVVAKNILISGKVDGTIDASEKLEIDPTGVVQGDIKTKILIVREGANFNGTTSMAGGDAKTAHAVPTVEDTATNIKPEEKSEDKEEKKDILKAGFWEKKK